jgi:hypothetical protein
MRPSCGGGVLRRQQPDGEGGAMTGTPPNERVGIGDSFGGLRGRPELRRFVEQWHQPTAV